MNNQYKVVLKQHGVMFSCQLAEEQLTTEDGSDVNIWSSWHRHRMKLVSFSMNLNLGTKRSTQD